MMGLSSLVSLLDLVSELSIWELYLMLGGVHAAPAAPMNIIGVRLRV